MRIAALPPVGEAHLRVGEWGQKALQPVGINRVYMGAGNDNKVRTGGRNTAVERVAKSEVLRAYTHLFDSVAPSYIQRVIGRT